MADLLSSPVAAGPWLPQRGLTPCALGAVLQCPPHTHTHRIKHIHARPPHAYHTCTHVHTTHHIPYTCHTQTHIKHTTHTMHTHTCAHTTSMSQTHIDQPPHVNTQHECTTHSTPARSGATDLPFTVSHFSSPSSAGLWASHAQGAARTV